MIRKIAYAVGVLGCLLAFSMPANATISIDTSASASSHQDHSPVVTGSTEISNVNTSAAGEVILLWIPANGLDGRDPEISISGAGITWNEACKTGIYHDTYDNGDAYLYLFWGVATSQLSDATITISGEPAGDGFKVDYLLQAFAGCNTSSPIDQVVTGAGDSTTSVSLTTGVNNTLAVGAIVDLSQGYFEDPNGGGYSWDDTNGWCNFEDTDQIGFDEYANSQTANSGTNVTVGWDGNVIDGDYVTMIGVDLIAA